MSTYYLLDMHVPVLANSRIVDVVSTSEENPEIRVDGLTPIRIPDGVNIVNPTSLTDLLAQKRAGIHAQYAGFPNIVWDDLLDGTGIDTVTLSSTFMTKVGSRSTNGGSFRANDVDVSPDVITQCVFIFEIYSWRYVDKKDGRLERYYVEEDFGALGGGQIILSANGGGLSEFPTSSGSLVTFAAPGSLLRLEFSWNELLFEGRRLPYVGYWAVIY